MAKLNTAIRGAQIADAVAGNGLNWESDDILGLDLKANSGLEISGVELAVKLDGATLSMGVDGIKVNSIANAEIAADAAIALDKLHDMADTAVMIGTGAGNAEYALSGDITMSNAGVTAIGATKVVDTMINDDVATGLAGTGLTATAGVLSVDDYDTGIIEADILYENESAECNDSNVTFTLAQTPLSNSVQVFLNGLIQEEGSGKDFTIDGVTITFVIAPNTGDILLVHFIQDN